MISIVFFFKQKTAYEMRISDWSSDVCSSDLQKRGFQRVKIDGTLHEIDAAPALDKKRKHDIEVVVDRLVVRAGIETRLADSFETALHLADGLAFAEEAKSGNAKSGAKTGAKTGARTTFPAKFACPVSG